MIKQESLKAAILNTHTVNDLITLLKQEQVFDLVDKRLYQQSGHHLKQDSIAEAKNNALYILATN